MSLEFIIVVPLVTVMVLLLPLPVRPGNSTMADRGCWADPALFADYFHAPCVARKAMQEL
jgi:hypothetical protein